MIRKKHWMMLCLWLACWQGVWAGEPRITLSARHQPIEQVLLEIERQSGLHISFESSLLLQVAPVTVEMRDATLSLCLYDLFHTYPIDWIQTDRFLILKRKGEAFGTENDTIRRISLQEFVVSADSLRHAASLTGEPGRELLSGRQIQHLPSILSQPDLIKGIQQLPGVALGTEGMAGMYVRGGNNDENLFLMDGMPVYQVSHVAGMFSAFNPDAVDELAFFKGFFPAKYAGRLSSVTDIKTKKGDMRQFHGGVGIGLIQGNFYMEGPIKKDKLSFHFAMRRSWADLITAPTFAIMNKRGFWGDGDGYNARYSFHDINGRLDYHHSARSRWSLSVYSGDDLLKIHGWDGASSYEDYKYDQEDKYKIRWGNFATALNWNYDIRPKLKSLFTASYTRYRSKLFYSRQTHYYDVDYIESQTVSGIDDGRLSWQFTYRPNRRHLLQGGISARLQAFRPEYMEEGTFSGEELDEDYIQMRTRNAIRMLGNENVLFLSDRISLTDRLSVEAGLAFSTFYLKRKWYTSLQPRFLMRYLWNDSWSAKLSYSRMSQPVHLIPSSYLDLPTDVWLPSTNKVRPSLSDQISGGIYFSPSRHYSFSLEGYYKHMQHLADFKPWVGRYPDGMDWEDKLIEGKGRSYGLEVTVRKETGKLTGWAGYTLSWADRQFPELNQGRRFPSRYDNRHKFNIVASYKLGKRVELNASWVYTKGNWMTLLPNDASSPTHYSLRNNYQLPDYHRLDVGINIYRPSKKHKGRMGIWNVSIYNVYNRQNQVIAWPEYERDLPANQVKVRHLAIFPLIPSFSYTYKF
ncbi:hypothetical protein B5F77_11600 [Parabacteroides sp. An277]|uniref:TonB-dependent receptor plug domain-containing protein n=1 Tax=Parabacteroides sp. An277 TaxID=1965619 RepID=UPI000B3845B7|nr:TonB-dependent receptor plug domain-containing protein [Parabacteroides sp. An277]OUO50982.1 hypothetical protein B5F77_11600 [Parabacteroides sp. An277]